MKTESALPEVDLPEIAEPTCSFHSSHKEQLLAAFRSMDVVAFEKLLSEEMTFTDNQNKWQFLAELKKILKNSEAAATLS